jgi:DnaJ-class molecular chaperone
MTAERFIECPVCHGEGELCIECEGEGRVSLHRGDPLSILRELRAHPLVAATAGDDEINGGDAVDALCEIREALDAALKGR